MRQVKRRKPGDVVGIKGMFCVGYGYGRSLLSVLCVHFVCISVRLLEAYEYGQNVAVPLEVMGAVLGGVAYSSSQTSETQWRAMFWKNGGTFTGKTV